MKKIILVLLTLFSLSSIYGMLPPLYHTLNEIQAIISDPRLAQEIGSAEAIIKIERIEDSYLITTAYNTQLKVDVIYIPQRLIGASHFELKFHEKISIETNFLENIIYLNQEAQEEK